MAVNKRTTALICRGLALGSLLGAAVAPAQYVSFIARRDFPAGAAPQSVAVGDFNGDGVPDLAVANYDSNNVSVLLGNGSEVASRGRDLSATLCSEALCDLVDGPQESRNVLQAHTLSTFYATWHNFRSDLWRAPYFSDRFMPLA